MRRRIHLPIALLVFAAACPTSSDENKYFLEASTAGSGSGTITLNPPGGEYEIGTTVTVTATASEGSAFTGWDEAAGDVSAACVKPVNPCSLTIQGRYSVIANFVPTTGVKRFDGSYFGSMTNSVGVSPPGVIQLTINNGAIQGTVAGSLTPSPGVFTATLSENGSFTAAIQNNIGGVCGNTTVLLTGQITTSVVDGITTANMTGTFATQGTPPQGCAVNPATINVNRRTVPKEATGV